MALFSQANSHCYFYLLLCRAKVLVLIREGNTPIYSVIRQGQLSKSCISFGLYAYYTYGWALKLFELVWQSVYDGYGFT